MLAARGCRCLKSLSVLVRSCNWLLVVCILLLRLSLVAAVGDCPCSSWFAVVVDCRWRLRFLLVLVAVVCVLLLYGVVVCCRLCVSCGLSLMCCVLLCANLCCYAGVVW